VLILRKLSKEDKPEASFDCTKAPSATERAVCSSHTLAGLDRSMSEAYAVALRNAKKIDPAKGKEMAATQRAWLHTRDDCLGDVRCLDRVMRQRVDVLADVPG
jgi:uncharacterized protein